MALRCIRMSRIVKTYISFLYKIDLSMGVRQLKTIKAQGGHEFRFILWHLHDKFIASCTCNCGHILAYFRRVHNLSIAWGYDMDPVAIRTCRTYRKKTLWGSSHCSLIWADYRTIRTFVKHCIIQIKTILTFYEI